MLSESEILHQQETANCSHHAESVRVSSSYSNTGTGNRNRNRNSIKNASDDNCLLSLTNTDIGLFSEEDRRGPFLLIH